MGRGGGNKQSCGPGCLSDSRQLRHREITHQVSQAVVVAKRGEINDFSKGRSLLVKEHPLEKPPLKIGFDFCKCSKGKRGVKVKGWCNW